MQSAGSASYDGQQAQVQWPIMSHTLYSTGLEMFEAAVRRAGDRPAIRYFDASLTYRDMNALSDALSVKLAQAGVAPGERVALYLQNMPHLPIAAISVWKLGAICVPINPMNKERELSLILADSTPKVLICVDDLYEDVVVRVSPELLPGLILRVSPSEFQTRDDARVISAAAAAPPSCFDALPPAQLPAVKTSIEDAALLVYTSGTTGNPKGAIVTHRAFCHNAGAFPQVACLAEGDVVLGIAPLFHITGIVASFGTAVLLAAPLILVYRFEPAVVLDAMLEWRPRFAVAAITAFAALYNHVASTPAHFASLQKVYSGGAPVPAAFVERFEAKFGPYIHNCYGLTETAAPTHIVPYGLRAPVDVVSGALSIGRPAPGAKVRVVQDDGTPAPTGTAGELAIEGPMVSPGYWRNPKESAASMRADGFRTGDVAVEDDAKWFYIVDRKKDMIISSGYKVWPREVEDVLYTHGAIREAAVVGVADAYRGESVKAFISLCAGAKVEAGEIIDYCRSRMAAYKYPRFVQILDDLPKTASGKIMRRALR
jgi:long-chain acyl-CoA synthetase